MLRCTYSEFKGRSDLVCVCLWVKSGVMQAFRVDEIDSNLSGSRSYPARPRQGSSCYGCEESQLLSTSTYRIVSHFLEIWLTCTGAEASSASVCCA